LRDGYPPRNCRYLILLQFYLVGGRVGETHVLLGDIFIIS